MCYNLATKCVICGEFIDSKVMKCLAREVYLSIDGIWIRGCEAGNTVDGWPFFNQYRLRSPIITCPNGGTLRLHGVRVVDALCYTCKFLVPEYENPEHEDYLGERCGNVYQADFERNVYYRIGSYLLLGSSKSAPSHSMTRMLMAVYRSCYQGSGRPSELFRVVHSTPAGGLE